MSDSCDCSWQGSRKNVWDAYSIPYMDKGSQTHMGNAMPGKAGGMVRKEVVGKTGRYIGMIITVGGNICSEQENRRNRHIYHILVTRTGDWELRIPLKLKTVTFGVIFRRGNLHCGH